MRIRPHVARTEDLREILPGLAALAAAIAMAADLLTFKLVGFDLAAYVLGARRLVAGQPLYQADLVALGPFGQFVYPPPVVLLFVPFAGLPFDVLRASGLIVLVGLAAVLTWLLVRDLSRATRYWAAASVVLFFPLIWEVTLENLTLVTLMCSLVAWRLRRSPAPAGAVFAVAIALKLLPLSLVAFLLGARRARMLLWSAGVAVAICVLSWPLVGAEWPAFLSLLGRLSTAPAGTGSNLVPVLFSAPPLRWVLPGLALLVALLCGVLARTDDRRADHAFRVALAAVPLLAATLWYPYLVFALPLLVTDAPHPAASMRWPFAVARPASWLLMQWEALRDPGREFLLPLVGLLLLLAVGLLELRAFATDAIDTSRADVPRPASYRA